MIEVELKFQLPESKKKSVRNALNKKKAQQIRLQAKYYDTPDRLLAQHGIAIRLRQEGDTWVQTFKASGKSQLHRMEEEVNLGRVEHEPELDLNYFQDNTQVMGLIKNILGSSADTLQLQFQTDVLRTYHVFHYQNSKIECCLDEGEIRSSNHKTKICEIEFELKQGSVQDLIEMSYSWLTQYQLWLDVRSKAERGNLLVLNIAASSATKAKPLFLTEKMHPEQALQQMVANCLDQILPNIAVIMDNVASAEHIHQTRIGLRRLRTALKHFGHWSDQTQAHWGDELTQHFNTLALSRDRDAVRSDIIPFIEQASEFELDFSFPNGPDTDLAKYFQQANLNKLILELLAFSLQQNNEQKKRKSILKTKVNKTLDQLSQKILTEANEFLFLKLEERHRVRKRIKQLRYCIDFVRSLYDDEAVKKCLRKLQPIQDELGLYQDLFIAENIFQQHVEENHQFWFALGWVKAQQPHVLQTAHKKLIKFQKIAFFW